MTIAVVGVGLMGGSFARDLRKASPTNKIIGCDTSEAHAATALALGLVDEMVALDAAIARADVLLLSVPVDVITTLLPRILDQVNAHQTVIDLGSTKGSIVASVNHHPHRDRFVAAHPMAGTEDSGPEAAVEGLFKDKTVLLCDLDWSAPDACRVALEIFHAVGMKFEFMSATQHDRHAAYVSHLSHVVAYALSLAVQSEEKAGYAVPRLAGGGFASTVRLAKSSPTMWVPIFQQNREAVINSIEVFSARLTEFKRCLEEGDWSTLEHLIREANAIRELL